MFSSISSINSIATKKKLLPAPKTHFTFNTAQTSGTTVTALDGSATMTITSTAARTTTGQKEGTACFFSGDKLYYGVSTNILISSTNGLSVSLWFKSVRTTVSTQVSYLFDFRLLDASTVMVARIPANSQNINVALISGGGFTEYSCSPSLTTILNQNWHHLVITWYGSSLIAYYDNILVINNSSSRTLLPSKNFNRLHLCNAYNGGTNLYGYFRVDCLRFYDKVLSTIEIDAIYKEGA